MSVGKFQSQPPAAAGDTRSSARETPGGTLKADEAARLAAELDWDDPNSILFFGARAQRELARISDRMLRLAAAESVGGAAGDIDRMLTLIRQFEPRTQASIPWWRRLLPVSPASSLVKQVSQLLHRMDQVAAALERRKTELLTDSVTMQRLADRCQTHYQELGHYEQVARSALARAPESLRADLLARCEDLAISRQVAQQSLAAMAVSQRTTRDLLARVNAVLDHTLVLWKQHLTQVIAIWRGRQTAAAIDELAATGQSLEALSSELAAARKSLAQRLDQGVIDVEAVVVANRHLVQELESGAATAARAREAAASATQLLGRDP